MCAVSDRLLPLVSDRTLCSSFHIQMIYDQREVNNKCVLAASFCQYVEGLDYYSHATVNCDRVSNEFNKIFIHQLQQGQGCTAVCR